MKIKAWAVVDKVGCRFYSAEREKLMAMCRKATYQKVIPCTITIPDKKKVKK